MHKVKLEWDWNLHFKFRNINAWFVEAEKFESTACIEENPVHPEAGSAWDGGTDALEWEPQRKGQYTLSPSESVCSAWGHARSHLHGLHPPRRPAAGDVLTMSPVLHLSSFYSLLTSDPRSKRQGRPCPITPSSGLAFWCADHRLYFIHTHYLPSLSRSRNDAPTSISY